MIFEVQIPYDALQAATIEILSNRFVDGFIDFVISSELRARMVIDLSQLELGPIGSITLRKLRDDLSEIYVRKVSLKFYADSILDSQKNLLDQAKPISREEALKIIQRSNDDADDLRRRRNKHLDLVVRSFLERLRQENIWLSESREFLPVKKFEKRGRSRLTTAQKLQGLKEWEELNSRETGLLLDEFLQHLENRWGIPIAKSTFHGWRKLRSKPS